MHLADYSIVWIFVCFYEEELMCRLLQRINSMNLVWGFNFARAVHPGTKTSIGVSMDNYNKAGDTLFFSDLPGLF